MKPSGICWICLMTRSCCALLLPRQIEWLPGLLMPKLVLHPLSTQQTQPQSLLGLPAYSWSKSHKHSIQNDCKYLACVCTIFEALIYDQYAEPLETSLYVACSITVSRHKTHMCGVSLLDLLLFYLICTLENIRIREKEDSVSNLIVCSCKVCVKFCM